MELVLIENAMYRTPSNSVRYIVFSMRKNS